MHGSIWHRANHKAPPCWRLGWWHLILSSNAIRFSATRQVRARNCSFIVSVYSEHWRFVVFYIWASSFDLTLLTIISACKLHRSRVFSLSGANCMQVKIARELEKSCSADWCEKREVAWNQEHLGGPHLFCVGSLSASALPLGTSSIVPSQLHSIGYLSCTSLKQFTWC